jgi:hypothetical protein
MTGNFLEPDSVGFSFAFLRLAMNCSQCLQKLPDWLDQFDAGTLDDAARAELETILESCPDFAREWRLALQLRETLRALPEPAAPTMLRANVRAAIRQTQTPVNTNWADTFFPRARPFVWAGGAGMAVLLLWIGVGGQLPTPQPPPSEALAPAAPLVDEAKPAPATSKRSQAPAPNVRPKLRPTPAPRARIETLPAPPAVAPLTESRSSTNDSAPEAALNAQEPAPRAAFAPPKPVSPSRSTPTASTKANASKPASTNDISPKSSPLAPPISPRLTNPAPARAVSQAPARPEPRAEPPKILARRAANSQASAPQTQASAPSTNALQNAGVTLLAAATRLEALEARPKTNPAPAPLAPTATSKTRDDETSIATAEAAIADVAPQVNAPGATLEAEAPTRVLRAAPAPAMRENLSSTPRRARFILRSRIALPNVELRFVDAPAGTPAIWRGDLAANTPIPIDAELPPNAQSPVRFQLEQKAAGAPPKAIELSVDLPSP